MPSKKYYQANPDKYRTMYMNSYYADRERYMSYKKKFNSTPAGKRCMTINNWKAKGMRLYGNESWNDMYNTFHSTNECCGCGCSFNQHRRKALDHNHDTGYVRGVLCYSCNRRDILANL